MVKILSAVELEKMKKIPRIMRFNWYNALLAPEPDLYSQAIFYLFGENPEPLGRWSIYAPRVLAGRAESISALLKLGFFTIGEVAESG